MKQHHTVFSTLALLASIAIVASAEKGWAFHSGGVAECEGCHTMHNSVEGAAMTGAFPQYQAGPYLLQGNDQSSSCLNCHEHAGDTGPSSYHISTAPADMPAGSAPLQLTPGGDFGWVKKTYSWTPRSGAAVETSKGERHGHNIIAADYGYVADSTLATAPGGSYPANKLACTSCHDPHGKYRVLANTTVSVTFGTTGKPIKSSGSYGTTPDTTFAVGAYRILGGKNYTPKSLQGTNAFSFDPFVAVAPTQYNRSEAATDTRVVYAKDVSLWCANCHEAMHSVLGSGLVHPAGVNISSEVMDVYNKYRKSGDLTGTVATAFSSLVPVQRDNSTDIGGQLLSLVTSTAGAQTGDRVQCLTCHRAHASGFDSITRFGVGNEFMTVADAAGTSIYPDPAANPAQAMGRTVAEQTQAYYGRPATKFAPYQRVYGCNKCHAKD